MGIMLQVEDSVVCIPATVGFRISPAIQQVPGGSSGVFRRGAVIDDIKLIPIARIQNEVIQLGIVSDRIAMEPISSLRTSRKSAAVHLAVVDVEARDVDCRVAKAWQSGVHVLNEVVPSVPLPHDLPAIASFGLDFIQHRRPERSRDCRPAKDACKGLMYSQHRKMMLPLGRKATS